MALNRPLPPDLIWVGVRSRLSEILLEAPWSSFDLVSALVVCTIGGYFLLPFPVYAVYPSYAPLGIIAPENWIGALFLMAGAQALLVVTYCEKPPFVARLCARASMALCFLILFGNAAVNDPPPPSITVWGTLFLASLLGIMRTRRHGH